MPWKLIVFLIALGLVVAFAGFNLGHTSDISFGFYTFVEVPIFISVFVGFFVGCLITLPIAATSRFRAKHRTPKIKKSHGKNNTEAADDFIEKDTGHNAP